MIKKNDDFDLTITGYTSEGSGVGKKDGIAVFVENTAKNDIIKCHIIKAKKNYAIGKAMKIVKPSKDRIEPLCEHFKYCGGCSFSHLKYKAEAELKAEKVKDAFLRIAHLEPEFEDIIVSQNTERYRNKAQYPVGFDKDVVAGFYAQKSHRIIDSADCVLQPQEFADIVKVIKEWMVEFGIEPYDSINHTGLVRHIYIRKAFVTGQIMVCLVINGNVLPYGDELCDDLMRFKEIKSVVINENTEKTNVILGKTCTTLWGDDYIEDVLCGVKIRLSPLSFYQVNHDCAELLYKKALEYVETKGNETILDLYCGAGTIGLSMAKSVGKVIGVEIIPEAIEDAKENAKLNGIENIKFFPADAGKFMVDLANNNEQIDAVIMDPARAGSDNPFLSSLVKLSPEKVVYVSCNPETLARDLMYLSKNGYKVKKIQPVDMFLHTDHVETVILLSRKDVHERIKFDLNIEELNRTSQSK